MSNVAIIADTVAGIPQDWIKKWGITVIPAAIINADNKRYVEGVDISTNDAYALAERTQKYSTSSISPGIVLDSFKKVAARSDQMLLVAFSSAMGAIYKVAGGAIELAREENPKLDIRVYDTKTVASAEGLLVMAAARAAAAGKSLDEIIQLLDTLRPRIGCFNLMETLKYVYRSGRVSRFKSELAAMMHIRPILKMMPDGTMENVARARDRAKAIALLLDLIRKELPPERCHFMILHAVAPEWAKELGTLIEREFNPLDVTYGEYSAIMGYASGKGCLSVGFMPEIKL
jgi:DegV family protein with EDD domain